MVLCEKRLHWLHFQPVYIDFDTDMYQAKGSKCTATFYLAWMANGGRGSSSKELDK